MGHNFEKEVADTRDAFLTSEIDYLKKLVQVPGFLELYQSFKSFNVGDLSNRLLTLTQMMENGEVKEEDASKVELEIMCCCLAIEDAAKSLGAKEISFGHHINGRNR